MKNTHSIFGDETGEGAGVPREAPRENDRRGSPRHNVYLPVTISGRDTGDRKVTESTFTVNISEGGAYILCRNDYRAGDQIDLYFKPWTEEELIQHLRAKVVRFDSGMALTDNQCGKAVGVAYSQTVSRCQGSR